MRRPMTATCRLAGPMPGPARGPSARCRARTVSMLATALFAALASVGAVAQDAAPEDAEVAATVDGRDIPALAVDNVARQLESDGTGADRATVLGELVDMEVLAQAAEREGLDRTPEIATALRLQRMRTLANAWLADAGERIVIGEDELRAEYARQAAGMPVREFRASHVLLDSREAADEVIAELAAGADFATLVAERSLDPSAGGALGWVTAGSIDAAIVDALGVLGPGVVAGEPVRTDFGFHVLRLDEARAASPPDFTAVRQGLRDIVLSRHLADRVAALRDAARIELR